MGIPVYIMGDVIRREARRRFGCDDAHHTGMLMENIRRELGMDVVAKLTLDKIREDSIESEYILIDGLRNPEELEYFRRHVDRVVLIAVLASLNVRYRRLIDRGRVDDVKSLHEFISREDRERRVGLTKLIRMADLYFINESIDEARGVDLAADLINMIMRGVY